MRVWLSSRMKLFPALVGPSCADTVIPKYTVKVDSVDYKSELAIMIEKTCQNVSEASVLGYFHNRATSSDVSSKTP